MVEKRLVLQIDPKARHPHSILNQNARVIGYTTIKSVMEKNYKYTKLIRVTLVSTSLQVFVESVPLIIGFFSEVFVTGKTRPKYRKL